MEDIMDRDTMVHIHCQNILHEAGCSLNVALCGFRDKIPDSVQHKIHHLADCLWNGGPFVGDDGSPTYGDLLKENVELKKKLASLGFQTVTDIEKENGK